MFSFLSYLGTFAGGSFFTFLFELYKNKVQIIECNYKDEDIMSKIPISHETGVIHNNIHLKCFEIVNTSNKDLKILSLIFQFDNNSKILSIIDSTKTGSDKCKKKYLKSNEASVTIKHFNRKDKVLLIFEVADVTKNQINVVEDNCIGIKINFQDKRQPKSPSKISFVN